MIKKKKILLIISSIKKWWWAEKSAINIYNWLKKKWDRIELLTFYDFKKEYIFKWDRISFWLNYERWIKRIFNLLFVIPFKLYFFIKKNKYELVISNSEDANFCTQLCKIFNSKLFITINVVHNNIFLKSNEYYLFRKLHKYADYIVTVSKWIELSFKNELNISSSKIETIYNMFNISYIQKQMQLPISEKYKDLFNDNIFNFITIGRLCEQKNHKFMLECFDKFHSKYKNSNLLLIYWDDFLLDSLLKKKKTLKSRNNIYFLWHTDNPYNLLFNSDCFLFSSNREWFWMVILESLICNLPVVSVNCNFWPNEIISDINKTSKSKMWIISEIWDQDNFIKNMEYYYNNKVSQNWINNFNNFNLENIEIKWSSLIDNLLLNEN